MAFNVEEFSKQIGRNGIAKASHYQVSFHRPRSSNLELDIADLSMRAESIEMPGRSIQASTYRDYGATREIGYASLYQPITVTFLCSADMRERKLFSQWQDLIIGDHRVQNAPDGNSFNVGYYDDYVANIEIYQYDETGRITFGLRLVEAYPRTINAVGLSYASDELVKLTVQFQYRYHRQL